MVVAALLASCGSLDKPGPVETSSTSPSTELSPSTLMTHPAKTCGTERWPVKTGTDDDVNKIDLRTVVPTTIAELITLPAPPSTIPNMRSVPVEVTVYRVSGTLVEYKREADSDYHLVIRDDSGHTMIAEIPSPSCVGGGPLLLGITEARKEFDAEFTVTGSWKHANTPITITGVGFFDSIHGQTGVAQNGIELHPVLGVS